MSTKKISLSSRVALLVLTGIGLLAPAYAHHSFAMFDKSKAITLQGVVRKLEWTNPHSFLFVEVTESAGAKLYTIECAGPNWLSRVGWKMNTVKVGDAVTVTIYPLRDGRPGGAIDTITLPNGVKIKAV